MALFLVYLGKQVFKFLLLAQWTHIQSGYELNNMDFSSSNLIYFVPI